MALFTFMDLLLYMVIFSLTASHVEGHSRPTSSPRMAGQSTSYGSFMPASNTPTCDFKILMTLRTCCTPSDLGYRVSVVLFCVILLTLTLTTITATAIATQPMALHHSLVLGNNASHR